MAAYVLLSGKHSRWEPDGASARGRVVAYKAGDLIEMTDEEARTHAGRIAPAAAGQQMPAAVPAEPAGHPFHHLSVADAVAVVDHATSMEALKEMAAGERAHPKFAGGRQGVLTAIDKRRAALQSA